MKRLLRGTLERMIELDYCIDCYSKVKVNKMKPVIHNIMRMGVYQILYMDSVPDSAACNESVKLAQAKGFATLKGFVNGVLRTIARNKDAIPYPDEKKDYRKYLFCNLFHAGVDSRSVDWAIRSGDYDCNVTGGLFTGETCYDQE